MVNIFGERLRELRESRSLHQEDLGEICGVGKAAVSGYENGKRYPNFDQLVTLADYFKVSTDYLLGRTDDRTPPENMDMVKENAKKLENILSSMSDEDKEKFFAFLEVAVSGKKTHNRPN